VAQQKGNQVTPTQCIIHFLEEKMTDCRLIAARSGHSDQNYYKGKSDGLDYARFVVSTIEEQSKGDSNED